jgi:pilus assembly protein Flp/PilA
MNAFGKESLRKFFADARGATAVEYGLMVALLSVAMIGVLFTTGDGIKNVFSTLSTALQAM